jgi:hypothetical protein
MPAYLGWEGVVWERKGRVRERRRMGRRAKEGGSDGCVREM